MKEIVGERKNYDSQPNHSKRKSKNEISALQSEDFYKSPKWKFPDYNIVFKLKLSKVERADQCQKNIKLHCRKQQQKSR